MKFTNLLNRRLGLLGLLTFIGSGYAADHKTYYQDVKPIMDANCVGCHSEDKVAFPLEKFE